MSSTIYSVSDSIGHEIDSICETNKSCTTPDCVREFTLVRNKGEIR